MAKAKTLIELSGEFALITEALLDSGGEMSPEIEAALDLVLEGLKQKADGYADMIREFQMREGALKAQATLMSARAKSAERAAEVLVTRAKSCMERMNVAEIKGAFSKLKIVNNGGLLPLEITGEVPDQFYKVVHEVDNSAIRDALAGGEKLDFARLGKRGTQLRVL